ncbi:YbjN domain-containing protein [Actinomyces trachealis]|uniref:YbjN domain-containing protein n=1 Tax=Actinomyces trachealis TaxID=2763540 RepID=UPI001892C618|nr:YbjN domain-containing protein [Actinomyces trachealis]
MARLIESRGWKCQVDDDGDLTGRWDDDLISFMLRGEHDEMLNVMGLMLEDVPVAKLDEARFAIDEWHREHVWPVCFWRENDDAGLTFTIGAAVAVDWEPGATDEQLLQHLQCGLATCGQAFADFRDRLALEPYEEPGA